MRLRFGIFVVAMLMAVASVVSLGTARAQDVTDQDQAWIVGSWVLTFPDTPDATPSFYTFSADGTVVGSSASGPRHGAWEMSDEAQIVNFTVVGPASAGLGSELFAIQIVGEAVVAESTNTMTIIYIVEPYIEETAGISEGPFSATGTRVTVQEITVPGTPEPMPEDVEIGEATPVV